MNLRSTLTTSAFAVAGLGLTWFAGGKLQEKGRFDYQPNPLGLKASPYGQVIAMAIQTPIDADWHGTLEIHDMPAKESEHEDHADEVCEHDHDHGTPCEHDDHVACEDDHANCDHANCDHGSGKTGLADNHAASCSDENCDHDHGNQTPTSLIDRLSLAVTKRTNPNPPTAGHRFYIRREIEKKLRFAYDLDPSHYANYNTYHLFLTQPELGTSQEAEEVNRQNAANLAQYTISYCLRESNDPRPALTASSAAYNILESMFLAQDKPSTLIMRKQLTVIDFCLQRHFELLEETMNNGNWALLSQMRQAEVLERSKFALKLREAAEKTIVRLETPENSTVNLDPS